MIDEDEHRDDQTPRGRDDRNPHVPWERNFTSQMKALRESHGWTQTDLAKLIRTRSGGDLRFHQQTIQRIENGERPVRLNEALLIADALGADLRSMTVHATPTAAVVEHAASGLRNASARAAEGLREISHDWQGGVELLTSAVLDRMLDQPLDFGNDESWTDAQIRRAAAKVRPDELDATTRAGLAWALKALSTSDAIRQAYASLVDLSGHDAESTTLPRGVFETLQILRTTFKSDADLMSNAARSGRELASTAPVSGRDGTDGPATP